MAKSKPPQGEGLARQEVFTRSGGERVIAPGQPAKAPAKCKDSEAE